MYRAALCEMPRAPRLVDGAATASDMDEDDDDAERSPAPLAHPMQLRRALPSVEHFVSSHTDSRW